MAMQTSPRLAPTSSLRNVSNTLTPSKKPRTPLPMMMPRTPSKALDGFITSTPSSSKRSNPPADRKRPKLRPPRTPNGCMFSPTYPPLHGAAGCHASEPATPTSVPEDGQLTPIQRSLQDNVARYGHLAQEFDEYDCDDFDPYRFIAGLPNLPRSPAAVCLPPKAAGAPRLTLVLDLDETLVHCSTDAHDIKHPDFVFHVDFQGNTYTVNARRRPGLEEFLEYLKDRFEVVVFTASQRVYADKLLDILDPAREIIHHRAFRDSCTNVEGNYLKDLRMLGRDLATTVIVDNSPQAFAFQLENGIPILSWFEARGDRELFKLVPLLERLADLDDVRPALRDHFRLHRRVEAKRPLAFELLDDMLDTFEQRLAQTLEDSVA